jgi:hypothetical protein
MILASLIAMSMAEKTGYWMVLMTSFITLPIRGFIASHDQSCRALSGSDSGWNWRRAAKCSRTRSGSQDIKWHRASEYRPGGRYDYAGNRSFDQPSIGGWIAQDIGYNKAFLILGDFAFGSIALWGLFYRTLKTACG